MQLGVVIHVILAFRMLRQEDWDLKASLWEQAKALKTEAREWRI